MRSLLLAAALATSTLASAQVLDVHAFNTSGHPTQAIWTPDGQYILVTITRQHGTESGIEVYRVDGAKIKRTAWQPLGSEPAKGIVLIPGTRVLAVGLSDAGVVFLSLDAVLQGKSDPHVLFQGEHSGSSYLAVTPKGDHLFVSNETLHGGTVGIIAMRRDPKGQPVPEAVAQMPVLISPQGIAVSPDSSRLYAVSETLAALPERLPGYDVPDLQHGNCFHTAGSNPNPNGGLFIIDAVKASAPPTDYSPQHERDDTIRLFNSGCGPVREAVSSDGHTLYVSARDDDSILVFDTAALEHDPTHAFLRSFTTNGLAPVGIALFDHDSKMLVANSYQFAGMPGNATVVDLTDPTKPKFLQTIKTGLFPHDITVSPDGRSLLLTIFIEDQVMVLTMK
jgi:DNA-binding beta-propeller fold protein YncE